MQTTICTPDGGQYHFSLHGGGLRLEYGDPWTARAPVSDPRRHLARLAADGYVQAERMLLEMDGPKN